MSAKLPDNSPTLEGYEFIPPLTPHSTPPTPDPLNYNGRDLIHLLPNPIPITPPDNHSPIPSPQSIVDSLANRSLQSSPGAIDPRTIQNSLLSVETQRNNIKSLNDQITELKKTIEKEGEGFTNILECVVKQECLYSASYFKSFSKNISIGLIVILSLVISKCVTPLFKGIIFLGGVIIITKILVQNESQNLKLRALFYLKPYLLKNKESFRIDPYGFLQTAITHLYEKVLKKHEEDGYLKRFNADLIGKISIEI